MIEDVEGSLEKASENLPSLLGTGALSAKIASFPIGEGCMGWLQLMLGGRMPHLLAQVKPNHNQTNQER